MKKSFFAIMALLFATATHNVLAATITVTSAEDSGEGSLRDAVAGAAHGDVITFNIQVNSIPTNTTSYIESGKVAIKLTSGEIRFDKRLTFKGDGKIILDGGSSGRILNYDAYRTLTLDGLTFKNGDIARSVSNRIATVPGRVNLPNHNRRGQSRDAGSSGGAVLAGGFVEVTNCDFINNHAGSNGGAIFAHGSITASGCKFSDNTTLFSGNGGAIHAGNGAITITDCVFSSNMTGNGSGAVFLEKGVITATDCVFTGNNADQYGGAVCVNDGAFAATGCAFSGNSAALGGAAYANPTITVMNCTFTDNAADSGGGAIVSVIVAAANSVFVGNRTGSVGSGAIAADGYAYLYHATVADNIGTGVGAYLLGIHNSIVTGNSAAVQVGSGNSSAISVIPAENITGIGLIEGITDGVTRAAVFGKNESDAAGIIKPLAGGIADKTADALTADEINVPKNVKAADIIAALQKDISGAPRPVTGKVSFGAKE